MKFKNPFKKKAKIKVFLKSGSVMTVIAASYNLEFNRETCVVTSWEFKGLSSRNRPLFIVPSEIIGLEVVREGYFV